MDFYIKGIENDYENKEILSIYELYPNIDELHPILKKEKANGFI